MKPDDLCDSLREGLPALFECSQARNGAVRVRTPLLYPDGDLVDVFVRERDGRHLVTDYGDALGWLDMQSVSGELTANQRDMITDACRALGITEDRGQLTLRCDDQAMLADAIHRLAQAVVRVADIWLTFRTRAVRTIADQVDRWLREQSFDSRAGVKHTGGTTGRKWTVDFEVSAADRTSLVFLLTGDTPYAVWQRSMQVFAGCSDLDDLKKGQQPAAFVSLFDNTTDSWSAEQIDEPVRLVQSVSTPVMWSARDELASLLANGAMPLLAQ